MRCLVIGLGKLGGPLAQLLAEAGHEVHGYDLDETACERWGVREFHPRKGIALPAPDHPGFAFPEMYFYVVPTPSLEDGTYDTSFLEAAIEEWFDVDAVHVVVSTVLPGDCARIAEVFKEPELKAAKIREGWGGIKIVYSPEFIRLGHVREDMMNPDFVLIGADDQAAGDKVEEVLRSVVRLGDDRRELDAQDGWVYPVPFVRLSVVEAELAKIALNTYVTTKISFANMIGEMADALDADGGAVCRAIGNDRRIGPKYLRPGGAYQGPCFPRDNRALAALARRLGTTADLAEATDRINDRTAERIGYFPEDEESGRGY
jgi:UDPglucose 6-dehydrogenase